MKRKYFYWSFLIFFLYLSTEFITYIGLYYLRINNYADYSPVDAVSNDHRAILEKFVNTGSEYIVFDKLLGWSIKADGNSQLYKSNHSGIRADREYEKNPDTNKIRIAAFGDSYTHCDDVKNNETWEYYLEEMNNKAEVINFGVSGFGLDQAYLRYLNHGVNYHPNVVLIGFWTNDIFRQVSTYRPFYFSATKLPLSKPMYVIKNDSLELIPNRMSQLNEYKTFLNSPETYLNEMGKSDYYYRLGYRSGIFDFSPLVRMSKIISMEYKKRFYQDIITDGQYNPESEAVKVTEKILESFYNGCIKNNSKPVIVIFPTEEDVKNYYSGKKQKYFPLLKFFQSKQFTYIDLVKAFDGYNVKYKDKDIISDHYTPYGNKLFARYINKQLNLFCR